MEENQELILTGFKRVLGWLRRRRKLFGVEK